MNGESPEVGSEASAAPDLDCSSETATGTAVARSAGRPPDMARQERRRTEILDAATQIFARVGFAGTDVQEIAAAAGVGKGTVYRYFPSKEELFLAAVDQGMRRLTESVDHAAAESLPPLKRIAGGVKAYLGWFDQHPEMVELLIQERAQFRDRQRPTYFVHRDANLGPWRELIRELIRLGVVRPLEVDDILEVISDLLYGTMFTNHFTARDVSLANQAERILEVIFQGILLNPQARSGAEWREASEGITGPAG